MVGAIAVGIGAAFFGTKGAVIGLLIALAFQGFSLFAGHKMALSYAKAQELPPGEIPWLDQAVAALSQRAGIPAPKLYLSPDPQPNAFAAGWKPEVAVVCINRGLLELMPQDQVVAVLAHEIGHIKNRDMLTMTVAAAAASFINMIAHLAYFIPMGDGRERNPLVGLLLMIFAPITATMIQLAISRTREFSADATAAELMGDARPMMGALQSLDRGTHQIQSMTAEATTAHMYIASPFGGGSGLAKLFSTHPPIEDRIRALQSL